MKRQEPAKLGAVAEYAVWLDGTETAEQRATWVQACELALDRYAKERRVIMSPITWTEKRPGDDRVPPVPDHIQGPDVRLLVAEAMVIANMPVLTVTSFLLDLDQKDLERLREITRRQHAKSRPGEARLTDQECDRIIEEIGPEAAYDVVRKAVDGRVLH